MVEDKRGEAVNNDVGGFYKTVKAEYAVLKTVPRPPFELT
jgi:hypothetical protein